MTPYLIRQISRLAEGLALPADEKQAARSFVLTQYAETGAGTGSLVPPSPDPVAGGFRGRAGPADLYYTAFGLRALAMLGGLPENVAAAGLALAVAHRCDSVIDWVSRLFCVRLLRPAAMPAFADVSACLEAFRCEDGGYAKAPGSSQSSTYHTFLAWLCYDLLEAGCPDADRIAAFVRSRQRADGGFAESAAGSGGAVNPTAAGLALSLLTGAADEEQLTAAGEFLLACQRADGSWPASPRSPAGDLLSTFTALSTLSDLEALNLADTDAAGRFVLACRRDGGYAASPADDQADVEYTFYGLGCRALLGR